MPDTLKRLAGPQHLTVASATLYTTPAATTTVIRNLHVCNTSASAQTFSIGLNASATTVANQLFASYQLPPNGVVDLSGCWVLGAGDYLTGVCTNATTLTVYISGVESS
jgi:hypothetical protein